MQVHCPSHMSVSQMKADSFLNSQYWILPIKAIASCFMDPAGHVLLVYK